MDFGALLGNDRLKENMAQSLEKQHISHFYLISGPKGSGKHTLARLLAAAIMCRGGKRPCMVCPSCRKIRDGNHPDFITVDDPEKKTVPVDLIRQARADMYVRPNESDYKIYLFPRAQDMGLPGQNALLKVLEEPPKYGIFLLLTDNPDKLLPTVRSRCTELKMQALPEAVLRTRLRKDFPQAEEADVDAAVSRSGGFLGQAQELMENGGTLPSQTEEFAQALASRNALALTEVLTPMEKWKRDALLDILQSWLELTEMALVCRSGVQVQSALARKLAAGCSGPQLHDAAESLRKAAQYTMSNVSPAAVCGWLAWALR